jgi:hypothetical protein
MDRLWQSLYGQMNHLCERCCCLPRAADLLERVGSRVGGSDKTSKRWSSILDAATANNLQAASGEDEGAAAARAAQLCDSRQVRTVVGDKLGELR